jgi:cell division protein FtsL
MVIFFTVLILLISNYIFFTLGRIYEINCQMRELKAEIEQIEAEIEAIDREIIESLAEEEGVQE